MTHTPAPHLYVKLFVSVEFGSDMRTLGRVKVKNVRKRLRLPPVANAQRAQPLDLILCNEYNDR